MKKLLVIPFAVLAGTAAADEFAYDLQFHRAQDTSNGFYTHKAAASFAYQMNYALTLQADTAITRFSDGSHNDNSMAVHASYQITDVFRLGGYVGWE
jgi:hypothetical protein